MKIIIFFFLITFVLGDWYHNSKAFTLTATNINNYLGQDQHVILDFFTPWCVYCQHMAGEYNQVYEHYQDTRPDILIAKMNCDEEDSKPLCRGFGVNSFPAIIYFAPNQKKPASIFANYRTFQHFVNWIDSIASMSEQTRLKITQQKEQLEKQQKEQQQKIIQAQLEKERLIQEEFEKKQKESQDQLDITEQIKIEMDQNKRYIQTIQNMKKQIDDVNQIIAELNTKVGYLKKNSTKLNWNHAIVFAIFGMLIGTLTTSCICFIQRRSDLLNQKDND